MDLAAEAQETLQQFLDQSDFAHSGGVITDLDGTALHEDKGRIYIPKPVELGFKRLHDLGHRADFPIMPTLAADRVP
jgi:hypothetical protein